MKKSEWVYHPYDEDKDYPENLYLHQFDNDLHAVVYGKELILGTFKECLLECQQIAFGIKYPDSAAKQLLLEK